MNIPASTASLPATGDSPQASPRVGRARVLLVDDHPITRQGLRAVLTQQVGVEVCGESDNAADALEAASRLQPDIVILDVSLRATNGLQLVKPLQDRAPSTRVLMVSMHDENIYADRALRAGAAGYVMKQEAGEKIAIAVEHLLRGEIYLSPKLSEKFPRRAPGSRSHRTLGSIEALSQRELEVYRLIGDGFSTRDIATRLTLSCKTIESYREHLKVKLGLGSGPELVRHAIESGRYETGTRNASPLPESSPAGAGALPAA